VIGDRKIICVIPARLDSVRFPQKILAILDGKPLLQWVWEAACRVAYFDDVVIAVDAQQTANVVTRFQGKWRMTDSNCMTGTERLVELACQGEMDADVWVNWQADEPFITTDVLQDLLQTCHDPHADIWTLKVAMHETSGLFDQNICKVVCDQKGRALYFSRAPIPYYGSNKGVWYRHVGMYAYTKDALLQMRSLPPCGIEKAESLEQLRFLFHGLRIQVHDTKHSFTGIDLPEHLELAQQHIINARLMGLLIENIPVNKI